MISSSQDRFSQIFGAVPDGDVSMNGRVARMLIRAGLAVVLIRPGEKLPACTLTKAQATQADKIAQQAAKEGGSASWERVRHECGKKHVLTAEQQLTHVHVKQLLADGANLAVAPGAGTTRMICVDVDTSMQRDAFLRAWDDADMPYVDVPGRGAVGMSRAGMPLTVSSPGVLTTDLDGERTWTHKNGGHYWFTVPDGFTFPERTVKYDGPGGWCAYYGGLEYVLVPPSTRPEGPYRYTGTVECAPAWLLDQISQVQAQSTPELHQHDDDPIDAWSIGTGWDELLSGQGYTPWDYDTCGCPTYTRPGAPAHAKSVTAHALGCTQYDTSRGHGPLHIWSDALRADYGAQTMSKLTFYAITAHGGDVRAAMEAAGVGRVGGDREPDDLSDLMPPGDGPPKGEAGPDPADLDPSDLLPGGQAPSTAAGAPNPDRVVRLTWADGIAVRPVHWLWAGDDSRDGTIPAGMLVLLAGREGTGKSTVGYGIAAQITRGTLPGCRFGRPSAVIVAAYEDSWEHTIKPRLLAAGADTSRVARIDVEMVDGAAGSMVLPHDNAGLEAAIREHDVALVLLDPLMSALSSRMKANEYQSVYGALLPIAGIADRTGCAFVGITHFNKSVGADPMSRIMGSSAFAGVIRGALVVHKVKPDEEITLSGDPMDGPSLPEGLELFLLGHEKSNVGRKQPTQVYSLTGTFVCRTDEGDVWAPAVTWHGETDETVLSRMEAESQPRKAPKSSEAADWLLGCLSDGTWHPKPAVVALGAAQGHSARTLDRAAAGLLDEGRIRRFQRTPGPVQWCSDPEAGEP